MSTDVKGVFVVEAEAAAQFMHDVGKVNTAEAGLHLLTAVLSQPSASRDAVAATEANALQVVCPRHSTCTCCGSSSSSLLSTCLIAICLQSTLLQSCRSHLRLLTAPLCITRESKAHSDCTLPSGQLVLFATTKVLPGASSLCSVWRHL